MPLAFITIGAIFLIAAVRDTLNDKDGQPGLVTLLKGDFTGQNNFLFWILAIWILGAAGYIPGFKPIANAFLVLFVVVLLLAHKGFFAQLQSGLGATTEATPATSNFLSGSFLSGLPSLQ